jgi:hypothetical protein
MHTHPARIGLATELLAQLEQLSVVPVETLFTMHNSLALHARRQLDTTMLRREVAAMRGLFNRLPASERHGRLGQQLAAVVVSNEAPLFWQVLRDSGGAAYAAHLVANYTNATQANAQIRTSRMGPIGAHATPLTGPFWARHAAIDPPRPTPGMLALVVFNIRHDCGFASCGGAYRALQEIAGRYGNVLQITLVAQTQGYFRNRPPQTPREEAEAIRHYFLDNVKLPGALVVETTPFIKRPDPDRRRVNAVTADQAAYAITNPLNPYDIVSGSPQGYIVAPDGTIVAMTSFGTADRKSLYALLDAMLPAGAPSPSARH